MQPFNNYNPYTMYQSLYGQQPFQTQSQPIQQPQIQNGGLVSVRNENEARSYPVAPGNSVTFKDENMPYIYVKTMSFNQLDSPIFERFKLVKEDIAPDVENSPINTPVTQTINETDNIVKREIEALRSAYGDIRRDVDDIKHRLEEKAQIRKADEEE